LTPSSVEVHLLEVLCTHAIIHITVTLIASRQALGLRLAILALNFLGAWLATLFAGHLAFAAAFDVVAAAADTIVGIDITASSTPSADRRVGSVIGCIGSGTRSTSNGDVSGTTRDQ